MVLYCSHYFINLDSLTQFHLDKGWELKLILLQNKHTEKMNTINKIVMEKVPISGKKGMFSSILAAPTPM